ncbi:ferritin-like metal-binding protein YciE [Pseudomonas duriflava]|uniref:Ferritin-like metal-binding protein YciE n=1 Tax=Pseudomonas duriflava TaxID=459528 RepID=A0A562Q2P7_9PSED|nr:ferritin-like domain-containing protein [Pseudomonas duriflava]TWI50934.1 ferritin-like metal-binding protein YciE [Pseudomonas duriflava]
MTTRQEHLIDWLKDAHGMEQQADKMLKGQLERLENYPKLSARIQQHIEETQSQMQLIEGCLTRLGTSPSTMKDFTGKFMAMGQAMGGMFMTDEVVKGSMASYVFENVEIAMYTVLISAAEAAGDLETKRVCEQILPQEIAMADWVREHLPEVTMAFMARSEAGETAKK